MPEQLVVVGASLAGLRTAEELRRLDYRGAITLVGDETHLPYDRLPLSKDVLGGKAPSSSTQLRTQGRLDELGIEVKTSSRATGLDLLRSLVLLDDDALRFDELVIATGVVPRSIAGAELPGVFSVRTRDDVERLLAATSSARSAIVVGARFLGGEIAAGLQARGLQVRLLESSTSPLSELGPEISDAYSRLHARHGVDLVTSARVASISGDARASGVILADGRGFLADIVVLAIGSVAQTKWLEGSGLTISDGVVCDQSLTAAPHVHAAGDVARWHNPRYGRTIRTEHWTNAAEHGRAVARDIVHGGVCHDSLPYAWSDQYESRIQTTGLFDIATASTTRRLDGADSIIRLVGDPEHVRGIAAINATPAFMKMRVALDRDSNWDTLGTALASL